MSFAKEAGKVSEGSPKKSSTIPSSKAPETLKDSKKRVWGFLSAESVTTKALEQAETQRKSPESKKSEPLTVLKGMKDFMVSSPKQPPKKKSKPTDSQLPLGKFLTSHFAQIEPISFAYPSDLPDPSTKDQLTITKMFAGSRTPLPTIIDLSIGTL